MKKINQLKSRVYTTLLKLYECKWTSLENFYELKKRHNELIRLTNFNLQLFEERGIL